MRHNIASVSYKVVVSHFVLSLYYMINMNYALETRMSSDLNIGNDSSDFVT